MGTVDRTSAHGRPLTKSDYAYQALRRQILDGELAPGERLLLRTLAEVLGLSVMPVRDALRLLERDGLVQTERHRGAIVTPVAVDTVIRLIGIRMWLEALAIPETLVRKYLPRQYDRVRDGSLPLSAHALVVDHIRDELRPYAAACRAGVLT